MRFYKYSVSEFFGQPLNWLKAEPILCTLKSIPIMLSVIRLAKNRLSLTLQQAGSAAPGVSF